MDTSIIAMTFARAIAVAFPRVANIQPNIVESSTAMQCMTHTAVRRLVNAGSGKGLCAPTGPLP